MEINLTNSEVVDNGGDAEHDDADGDDNYDDDDDDDDDDDGRQASNGMGRW